MKKRWLMLSLMACAVFAFTACGETGGGGGGNNGPDDPGIITPDPEKITITVDANGGKFSGDKSSLTAAADGSGKVIITETPVRGGYTFKGYNTKSDGSGSAVTFGTGGTVFTENGTVYAQWEKDTSEPEIITVTIDANGGKFSGDKERLSVEVDADGKAATVEAPSSYGNIFKGYNTEADGSGTAVTLGPDGTVFTESGTIYAVWQLDRASLVDGYRLQFSTPEYSNKADVADDMYLKAERANGDGEFIISMIGFGELTSSEYVKLIFHTSDVDGSGWNIQASDLSALVGKTKAAYRTGLTKFWSHEGGYTVFDNNETALAASPVYAEHNGFFTLSIEVADSEIPGFDKSQRVSLFAMEFGDGTIYDATPFTYGMTVDGVAQGDPADQNSYFEIYRPKEAIVITVDGNGGKFTSDESSLSVTADDDGRVEEIETPTRDGYTFVGFNTSADGSGETVTFGADGTVFTESTAVYAQWTKDDPDTIEITVNANGGKIDGESIVSVVADEDGKIESVTEPTRYGYVFEGFNTKVDGSGETVAFGADGTVFTESISVYAQWRFDRNSLIAGYRMQFSTPELNNKAGVADDMYLKARRTDADDGFIIDMIGFGDFTDSEYVKLIFHTSATNGTGWGTQASDLTVLVGKTKAMYRTGLTKFWDYVNFGSDTALSNAPEYAKYDDFFTLKVTVSDSEIPEFSKSGKVSLFAMEFAGGAIYDGKSYLNGMLIDGFTNGDPAAQSSYFTIYGGETEVAPEGFDMKFACNSDNIYAKVERGVTSMTLTLRGTAAFGTGDDNFVRFVLHRGPAEDSNEWQIARDDLSIVIYKDAAYTQSGYVSLKDNEANKFHGNTTTIHAPVFTQHDGYWELTLTVEYVEVGGDIYQGTALRALLAKYTNGSIKLGAVQNGVVLGYQSYQKYWFEI